MAQQYDINDPYDLDIMRAQYDNHPKEDWQAFIDFTQIMKDINIKKGEIDVIAGGPPCQGFSMANRKRIEQDDRNLLFLEFVNEGICNL